MCGSKLTRFKNVRYKKWAEMYVFYCADGAASHLVQPATLVLGREPFACHGRLAALHAPY